MKHFTLNSFVKITDKDITTVKLIETHSDKGKRSFTVEIKQGLFITELQYNFDKTRALVLYGALIDNKLDIYLDKFSVKQCVCDLCSKKDSMLYDFDNNMKLCEDCAAQYGIDI